MGKVLSSVAQTASYNSSLPKSKHRLCGRHYIPKTFIIPSKVTNHRAILCYFDSQNVFTRILYCWQPTLPLRQPTGPLRHQCKKPYFLSTSTRKPSQGPVSISISTICRIESIRERWPSNTNSRTPG